MTILGKTISFDSTEEYVLMVGGEGLRFVAQPELGYVVEARQDNESIKDLDGMLQSVEAVNISPIKGLDRKGVFVVYSERPAAENERTIRTLASRSSIQYAAPLFSSNGEQVAIIPEIVIRVKSGTETEQVQTLCETAGCTINKRMEFTEQEYLIDVLGMDAEAVFTAVEQLNEIPLVEWACPNTACQPKVSNRPILETRKFGGYQLYNEPKQGANSPGIFPNDEYFPKQWHLHNTGQSGGTLGVDIRATEAWEITTGDPNVVIAEFGGYVDMNHPDLADNLVQGYDFVQPGSLPIYDYWWAGHSTWCAGIIAAKGNNEIGVAGVTWNCKIMPIRIWADNANGHVFITKAEIATAIRWAATNGADVMDNQWGQGADPVMHSALVDVTKPGGIGRDGKGCVVVFTSGDAPDFWYPGAYPEVIAVGCTDHNDIWVSVVSYGPELDIVAPDWGMGELKDEGLWTTDVTGLPGMSAYSEWHPDPNILDYTTADGATSIIAGVAALILSVDPNLTNVEVQRILYRSAHDLGEPGWDQYYGFGRVDARAAVEMALDPPPPLLHYVDDDAPGDPRPGDPEISDPNENGSAEHPFDSIQEAINNAIPGETVIILPGTYTGKGNHDISFLGRAITVRSLDPNDSTIVAATVIDCQGSQSAQHQGFIFKTGESSQSVLAGLIITNAYGSYSGGIFCTGNSSPIISKCVLSSNTAIKRGGGIYITSGSPLITNCLFRSNTAENGGALYNLSNARLINCTFTENSATTGGGIYNQGGTLTLTNCILWNNSPAEIHVGAGKVSVTYSDIQGGWEGEGNIDADPLFANVANSDYHLKSQGGRWDSLSNSWIVDDITSLCIDSGDPNSDCSDETWPHGERINMGAYGGTREASMSTRPETMSLPTVAYIYLDDEEAAQSFQSLLMRYGCLTTLIKVDDVATISLDSFDLIIVANDTGQWSTWVDSESITPIDRSGKPILGLGKGGYDFFGQFELSIGRPNGMHDDGGSIYATDPSHFLFGAPYPIDIPEGGVMQLYTATGQVILYLWPEIPETVTVLAKSVGNPGYYPLALESDQYVFWGFMESPPKMTEIGKSLFINVVIRTANRAWGS